MIPFHKPSVGELEEQYVIEALRGNLCGDGIFTAKARELIFQKAGVDKLLLTTSGTHALEMAAVLCNIEPGDEVIMPSYTFPSTANAFLLRGAKLVFCDIDARTMNMDCAKLQRLITPRVRALVPVDYAGVSCDMSAIRELAQKYGLFIVEDAAQAIGSCYNGSPCGVFADFACYSFHSTKNFAMGEGGALRVTDTGMFLKAEMLREKGTDRSQFLRGEKDKYTWRSIGSSYLPSDLLSALLCGQLERFESIIEKRMSIWNSYHEAFLPFEENGVLRRPFIPEYASHNAHLYYLILKSSSQRDNFILEMKKRGVSCCFHYIPLHSSPMGNKLGYRAKDLPLTEKYARRLVRLPLWVDTPELDVAAVIDNARGVLNG